MKCEYCILAGRIGAFTQKRREMKQLVVILAVHLVVREAHLMRHTVAEGVGRTRRGGERGAARGASALRRGPLR